MSTYDLIVIGTGLTSLAAKKAATSGQSVALIDERPPGGTCALRGCTPKKYLRAGAEIIDVVKRMNGKGVEQNGASLNWRDMQKHRYEYTDPIPGNNQKIYSQSGIDFFAGSAFFASDSSVTISKADGSSETLTFKQCVIATGARSLDLTFPGHELVQSSDDFLNLEDLPKNILFIGGGFISMEYAHIAARFGAQVQVIQRGPLPLKTFDPDLVQQLVDVGSEHAGVAIRTHSEVIAVRSNDDGTLSATIRNSDSNEEETIQTDAIFNGAGRQPNVDRLQLAAGNIDFSKKGVTVNEYLQSPSNPRVFAAGDCADTGAPQLLFTAKLEGLAVSANVINGPTQTVNYRGQASVAFTLPPIAQAGLSEQEAQEQGIDYIVKYHESARWFTNRRLNEGAGAVKILIDKESDRIIGAHVLAHHCEEFINVFALAIHHGMTRADLRSVPWAHPSSASDMNRLIG